MRTIVIGVLLALASLQATAWDGAETGIIENIEVSAAENYGFRVTLKGTPPLCGSGSPTWAYLNKSNDNYQAFVSTLMAISMSGKRVIIFTNKNTSNGQCQIGHVTGLIN